MTSSRQRREIQNLLDLLAQKDIAIYATRVVEHKAANGVTRVTWAKGHRETGELYRSEFATVDDYCSWIEVQEFSALLFDGSILQISFDLIGNEIIRHRLAYYPCPFDIDQDLLRTEPLLDVLTLYRGKADEHVRLRSPLRFDFDREAKGRGHAASHLTIIWSHCRWPVMGPLSLGHFVRFVFKQFYPKLWEKHDFLREWAQQDWKRTIVEEEENLLHISWRRHVGMVDMESMIA